MSPRLTGATSIRDRFPRVSGDEPAREGVLIRAEQFSPRERG